MILAVAASAVLAACAAPPPRPVLKTMIQQADLHLSAGEYVAARDLYGAFVKDNPGDPQVARANAMRKALDRMLTDEAAITRLEPASAELPRVKRELAERQSESERLKGENDRLRAEAAKLRETMEKLRRIDLGEPPQEQK